MSTRCSLILAALMIGGLTTLSPANDQTIRERIEARRKESSRRTAPALNRGYARGAVVGEDGGGSMDRGGSCGRAWPPVRHSRKSELNISHNSFHILTHWR